MNAKQPVSVFWFRRDLRLTDNHGLYKAVSGALPVLPVFIFDRNILDKLDNKKDRRVSFIHEALQHINHELQKHHSSILAIDDTPIKAFEKICSRYEVKAVFANHDYEPEAICRDKQISDFLSQRGIQFHTFKDHVIFERNEILKPDHTPYVVFTPYANAWKRKFVETPPTTYKSADLLNHLVKEKFPFPSLREIGFENINETFTEPIVNRNTIQSYHLHRNLPSINGTSKLSVHLRFGTVSIRELAKTASELNEAWLNELIWRDFFIMILFHFPRVIHQSFRPAYDHIPWRNNEKEFELWCKGETGYLIVDAGMRELNATGFMHNRVRMIVASFLTKHLLIDWRWGEHYFAEKLIDYELASNNGNWQWAAGCGCDAAPYFRIFNPLEQTKKFDPDLLYIKKWVTNFQISPIIDHKIARERALSTYKNALMASR